MPLVQNAVHAGCADASTATESEAGETRTLIRHSQKCVVSNSVPRFVLGGSAIGVLLMVVGAVALLRSAGRGAAPASAGAVVSAAATEGHGCENWRVTRLDLLKNLSSVDICQEECRNREGCVGYGFQPDSCNGTEQVGEGACYLWDNNCVLEVNECWDNYVLPEAERKPATWSLDEAKTGCSNWEEVKLGDATIEMSAGACANKCGSTAECIGFNFQPEDCSGREMVARGACYLWRQPCLLEENSCWDQYDQLTLTTLTGAAAADDTTLSVASEDGFEVGDRVTITDTLSYQTEERILTGINPLTFESGLQYSYPSGTTTVTTPVKPSSTGTTT